MDTSKCTDPDAANAPITGTLKLGSVMPLSGGVAALAFSPVAKGLTAYVDYANEHDMLGGVKIELSIEDDQYLPNLTPGAVDKLLDAGVQVFTGIIGTPNNLAVRETLNDECYPQLNNLTGAEEWGDVAHYPWTTGLLTPYPVEAKTYAADIKANFPGGAKVAEFYVNTEFGQSYIDGFREVVGDDLDIVDVQTIEAEDQAPPTAQVNSIASKKPDAIMAIPLGAQCATFLSALVNAKAANPGWEPRVYMTNTCASKLILDIAGPAADGLYTSMPLGALDIGNPEVVASNPAAKEYADYMTSKGHGDIITTGAAGWAVGDVTVAILKQAKESPAGLTRASIIDAARNFSYTPLLTRPGVVMKMSGEEDPFLVESVQLVRFDATKQIFDDVGTLDTSHESG